MSGRFRLGALVALVFVAGGSVYAVDDARRAAHSPAPLIGMVRRTEIRIAPELSGRLGKILVKPGARVVEGEALAELEAPDLVANSARLRRRPPARAPSAPISTRACAPRNRRSPIRR